MKRAKFTIPIFFLLTVAIFTALFPFPVFSHYTNLDNAQMSQINSYYETEIKNNYVSQNKILQIGWNEGLNSLFDTKNFYEMINLADGDSIFIQRIGGVNHADVVLISRNTFPILEDISKTNSYIPVLLKLNDNTYVPACFSLYSHGYHSHYCLHFKGTKTDGTQKFDPKIQSIVNQAKSMAKDYLASL